MTFRPMWTALSCFVLVSNLFSVAAFNVPRGRGSNLRLHQRGSRYGRGDEGYIYHAAALGANPNATIDSTDVLQGILNQILARKVPGHPSFGNGGSDRGGATLHLDGGQYLISRQLNFLGAGNIRICCGSLLATPSFSASQYLLRMGPGELITIEDVAMDVNHTAGGIYLDNVLRATLDRIDINHFASYAVRVIHGHEVHITNSFFGEYHWSERAGHNYTGVAIEIDGQDHWISDVTIYSCQTGIVMTGGAAIIEGVHVYNGGTGPALYLRQHNGAALLRAVGNYWDGRGVVVETPVRQVLIADSLFLQGTGVELRTTSSTPDQGQPDVLGLVIVNNQFEGSGHASSLEPLNQPNTTLWINASARALGRVSQSQVEANTMNLAHFQKRATTLTLEVNVSLTKGDMALDAHVPLPLCGHPGPATVNAPACLPFPLTSAPARLQTAVSSTTMAVPLAVDASTATAHVKLLALNQSTGFEDYAAQLKVVVTQQSE